ncbi:hypothetical protein LEP1GSC186_1985 [Leptospira noguchii serovar Autumnalis str. ZUN142]|uniref:Uncharacterized protein n=1 Tax=Leptospira noguchii serovar Autumnalis str. ZUN142 TaxID=1085540 RepID=M6UFV1_9LEPT|nr:hypothetical protein LEP1GSC186_1985 [Leptospira noguchii serovar Autumnalis str. ZUN142]
MPDPKRWKLNTTLSTDRVGNSTQRFPKGRVGNSTQRFPKGRVVGWELSFTEDLS